jgi:hypothetical protein
MGVDILEGRGAACDLALFLLEHLAVEISVGDGGFVVVFGSFSS